MECDYGGDDDDKMSDVSLHHMFDNNEYDWREALRVVGLSDEYISKHNDVSVLHITREEDIAPWSPDIDSSNPFVAVQKLLTVEGRLNRTMITSEAFWAGSEESTKFWPNMLLGCYSKRKDTLRILSTQRKMQRTE